MGNNKKKHVLEIIGNSIPEPPLNRVIRQCASHFCKNCGSTLSKNGFLGIFGKMLCHNQKCINSKPKND